MFEVIGIVAVVGVAIAAVGLAIHFIAKTVVSWDRSVINKEIDFVNDKANGMRAEIFTLQRKVERLDEVISDIATIIEEAIDEDCKCTKSTKTK